MSLLWKTLLCFIRASYNSCVSNQQVRLKQVKPLVRNLTDDNRIRVWMSPAGAISSHCLELKTTALDKLQYVQYANVSYSNCNNIDSIGLVTWRVNWTQSRITLYQNREYEQAAAKTCTIATTTSMQRCSVRKNCREHVILALLPPYALERTDKQRNACEYNSVCCSWKKHHFTCKIGYA